MRVSNRIPTLLLGLACALAGARASADAIDEVAVARAQLNRSVELLDSIAPYMERPELGRVLVLRQANLEVLTLIELKGLAHMATLREYQVLIVAYRFSFAFFNRISTEVTQEAIGELLRINEQIVADRGFDDSPYTQVTYSVFSQLHKLFGDLARLSLDPGLGEKIAELTPELGGVLALAKQGDRPKTFEAARTLHGKIVALYPEFERFTVSHPGFDLVINIQGLVEFYAEYAQID